VPDDLTPPPVVPPPISPPPIEQPGWSQSQPPPNGKANAAKKLGPFALAVAALLAKLKTVGTLLLTLLKFAKLGKIALTAGTMLLSIWVYAQIFGTWFAVGVVLLIFVHEMGHVIAAYREGIPVSAPIFIPFFGALILTRKLGNKLITQDAIIGIGGPLLGTVGAAICVGVYELNGSKFMLALGFFGFFINLFNLTPVFPLDGGWIVRAVSPILWLVGFIIFATLVITRQVYNPLIFILIILGIPTMWTELRAYFKRIPSPVPAAFRWKMGAAYLGLAAVCMFGMAACDAELAGLRQARQPPPPRPPAADSGTVALK